MGSSPLLSLIWGNKEMCVSRFDSHLPEGRKWIYFRLLGLASFFLSPRHLSWVLRKQTNLALRAFCSPQALQCGIRFHISLYKIKPYNYKPYPHPLVLETQLEWCVGVICFLFRLESFTPSVDTFHRNCTYDMQNHLWWSNDTEQSIPPPPSCLFGGEPFEWVDVNP